jgi:hypothetical protein
MRNVAVDQIFTATPFWYWLYSKDRIRREEGGQFLGIQLLYGKNNTVKTIGRGGQISIAKTDNITTAKFDWKTLAGSLVRYYDDEKKNRGKNQIMNWIKTDLRTLELSMVDSLETMLLSDGTGNGGLDFDGLSNLVSSTSGQTVGGIDSSTYTWWDNKRYTWVGGDSIHKNFRKAYNNASIGNDHPSFVLSPQAAYEAYEDALVNLLRVTDSPPGLGDMGFEVLRFKGSGVTFSNNAAFPTDKIYFLNERYMELVIDAGSEFEMTEWKPIPDQLDRVAQVVLRANLVVNNRRMQQVITAYS